MQKEIIRNVHERGHISSGKIEHIIRQDYDILKLSDKVKSIISNCVHCILAGKKYGKQEG